MRRALLRCTAVGAGGLLVGALTSAVATGAPAASARADVRTPPATPACPTPRPGALKALPKTVWIEVRAHRIAGTHRGERGATRAQLARNLKVLNRAFAGRQAHGAADTRFRFRLAHTDTVRNDRWFHLGFQSAADTRMRRALHRGSARVLNLYLVKPRPTASGPVLGWSSFPWQHHAHPRLDGVVVNIAALPGGRATGYNLGDTLVHETGHWLGLRHSFESPCGRRGARAVPARARLACAGPRATASAGSDPRRDFMNVGYDGCLDRFTPRQATRLDTLWSTYRAS